MLTLNQHPTGRHFLQIPGPSPVPDRILRAMSLPTIDHRGPEFGALGLKLLAGIQRVFQTKHPVAIYPASGTGAWEAALANTMSPGDRVLMYETGHFAALWQKMATRLGLQTEFIAEPGAFVLAPRGSVHTFKNIGTSLGRFLITCTPAGIEKPFRAIRIPDAAQGRAALTLDQITAELGKHGITIHGPPLT